jgi:hypothetical protein
MADNGSIATCAGNRPDDMGWFRSNRREKEMKTFAALLVLAAAASPALACERPTAPTNIPDGTTASKEEMLAAKKEIDAFKLGMEGYLACEKSTAKKDAGAMELVKLADRFNAQVKAFKAKG